MPLVRTFLGLFGLKFALGQYDDRNMAMKKLAYTSAPFVASPVIHVACDGAEVSGAVQVAERGSVGCETE